MDVRRWDDRDAQDPARAVIERIGRWTYAVHVECGISRYGPIDGQGNWNVFGRRRAERKARKVLRQYLSRPAFVERWEICS